MTFLSVGQPAEIVGVSMSTLRRWEAENYFMPDYKTKGGHRRYCLTRIQKELLVIPEKGHEKNRKIITYARVSSSDQKLDLRRQEKRLAQYCHQQNYQYDMISDLGSGINYKKKGLNKLIDLIIQGKVSQLILTHKDRLLRFGSPLLFKICQAFQTKVVILEDSKTKTFEQELVADVIEIMTVFTSKMYGKRSHQNKKICSNQ